MTGEKQVKYLIIKYIDKNFFRKEKAGSRSLTMYKDMIVVHLRFLPPNVKFMDVKYTMMDHLANFGGNFGIFAEVTGCSFLALLNIFILMMKNFARKD